MCQDWVHISVIYQQCCFASPAQHILPLLQQQFLLLFHIIVCLASEIDRTSMRQEGVDPPMWCITILACSGWISMRCFQFITVSHGRWKIIKSWRTSLTGFRLLPQYWGRKNGVLFLRCCISLKNWSYRPLLRDSTSPFKSTCLLTRLKEVPDALYRPHLRC
jgi:hypothetical protein